MQYTNHPRFVASINHSLFLLELSGDRLPIWRHCGNCPPSRNNHGAADARLNPFASTTTTNLSHFLRNVVCSYLCTGTSYCLFAPSRGQKVFFRFLRASSSIKQIVQTSLSVCIDRPHGWSLTIIIQKPPSHDPPGAFILGGIVVVPIHAARLCCLFIVIGALVVTDRPYLTTTCDIFSY